MRLFLGVELDQAVKAAAADAARELRERLAQRAGPLSARWLSADAMHITLWFIGDVSDERADAVRRAVGERPFETASFDLELGGCGAFPPTGPPRVFWIGVRRGAGEMARLYREPEQRLGPLGYEPERRGYTAHLTIARVKDAPRGGARAIRGQLADVPAECGTTRVDAVTVFRSRLSPRGATYEPLLRVPLS